MAMSGRYESVIRWLIGVCVALDVVGIGLVALDAMLGAPNVGRIGVVLALIPIVIVVTYLYWTIARFGAAVLEGVLDAIRLGK
jgi:hypothetical protein